MMIGSPKAKAHRDELTYLSEEFLFWSEIIEARVQSREPSELRSIGVGGNEGHVSVMIISNDGLFRLSS